MKDLDCPRILMQDEIESIDWDEYTTDEIDFLIDCKSIEDTDIIRYYNNIHWRDKV